MHPRTCEREITRTIKLFGCRLLKESEGLLTEEDVTSTFDPDPMRQLSTSGAMTAP